MLPTLGQGMCQQIEDAAALVRCLCSYTTNAEFALRTYEDQRSRWDTALVRPSRRLSDLRQHALSGLRDALVRTGSPAAAVFFIR